MTAGEFFKKIYEPNGSKIFHNIPCFISSLFSAGGSNWFDPHDYSEGALAGDYTYKIYTSKRPLSRNIRTSFKRINKQGLLIFFEKRFQQENELRDLMSNFGLSGKEVVNRTCFFSALVVQFEMFITCKVDDIDDIVVKKYKELLESEGANCEKQFNVPNNNRNQYRYSILIYEDNLAIYNKLVELFNEVNNDEEEYYIDIPNTNIATEIIKESSYRDIDAYIIDISRPSTSAEDGAYTDYSFSGKDLLDELIKILFRKAREGKGTDSAFFIYSTMISSDVLADVDKLFDYTESTEFGSLSIAQREEIRRSIEIFLLDKMTYDARKVSRRVTTYFDEKYSQDFRKAMNTDL